MEVLLFGIVREIAGASRLELPGEAGIRDVASLRAWLVERYPRLEGLRSLAVAVNNEYAEESRQLEGGDEIALIPPVSGG